MPRAYDVLAPYYDLLRLPRPGELVYWGSLAERCGGVVLELGCGTGRILEVMARAARGQRVFGLDTSPVMLRCARTRLRRSHLRAHLLRGDMRAFRLPARFALIAIPYRTFQHLLTREDQAACLECIRAHLEPGGLLALDVGGADPDTAGGATALRLTRTQELDGATVPPIVSDLTVELDTATGLARHVRTLSREGRVLARAEMQVRYLREGEVEEVLGVSGFRIQERLSGFRGERPAPGGDRILLARAP